jgi:hypothetical protein
MLTFIKSAFSENGEGSYSRIASGVIVLATLGWVSHVVFKTHALPDLTGALAFMTGGVTAHYGVNKFNDYINDYKNGTPTQPTPPIGG